MENRKNIGGFEKNISIIEIKHWEVSIPVSYTHLEWIDFAKQIEAAGADALEINILALQSDVQYTYGSFGEATPHVKTPLDSVRVPCMG